MFFFKSWNQIRYQRLTTFTHIAHQSLFSSHTFEANVRNKVVEYTGFTSIASLWHCMILSVTVSDSALHATILSINSSFLVIGFNFLDAIQCCL